MILVAVCLTASHLFYRFLHQARTHVSYELKDDVAVVRLNDPTSKVCVWLWKRVSDSTYMSERDYVCDSLVWLSQSLTDRFDMINQSASARVYAGEHAVCADAVGAVGGDGRDLVKWSCQKCRPHLQQAWLLYRRGGYQVGLLGL